MKEPRTNARPPMSFTQLIQEALQSGEGKAMLLTEIYEKISANHPFFRIDQSHWKNSVRHALSASKLFQKIPVQIKGRKYAWKLTGPHDKTSEDDFYHLANPITPITINSMKPGYYTAQFDPFVTPTSKFKGFCPNPDLSIQPELSPLTVTVGIETDALDPLWLPLPRDPLSDIASLPPIYIPEEIMIGQSSSIFNSLDGSNWSL